MYGVCVMDVVNGPPTLGSITFMTGSLTGKTYQITRPTTTIGREPTNDIVISDPSVSRHHAQVTWSDGVWTITKLTPQNTMTVNQRDMQQASLNDKDTIGLGTSTTFLFRVGDSLKPAANGQQAQHPDHPVAPRNPVAPPPPQAAFVPQPPMQDARAAFATQRAQGSDGANMHGTPSLEISTNTDSEKRSYPLPSTKQVFGIGRDPSNEIVINRPTISGFHAQIVREGNQLVFVHPHPARGRTVNGVSYNGYVYQGTETFRKPLARGDVFRISDEHGSFVTLTYNDGSGAVQDVIPEIRPIQLGAPVITIGRLPDNVVVLNHPQVSGHHARLEQGVGGYHIVDLGSTNHVYVGGERTKDQVLKAGDEIRIGPFKLTYTGAQLTQQDESSSIRIDALHLIKTVGTNNTVIIHDISIVIPPRKFVALVGGSGAGKSTLMDTLNGLRPAQQGTVLYNGQDYYHNLAAFSTQLGYVPQDDIIHHDLTVERALYYAARLRLPSDFTENQIRQRIEEVLDDVEMKFRRNVLVSRLSGGQRKRVSIALELLANPNVFFLDEPTSGLDPGLDRKMMLLLRRLADRGRTIVLVTHATNNINSCDYVCFLCRGGRLAYFGPPDEAKAYFGKSDFAEIYSTLEPPDDSSKIPEEAEARFKQSSDFQRYVAEPLAQGPAGRLNAAVQMVAPVTPLKRGNPWKQFSILSARYLELLRNDVGNLLILLLQAPIIGIILFFLAGHGAFDITSIAYCPGQTVNVSGQNVPYSNCQQLSDLLHTDQGSQYAASKGQTPDELLQTAIKSGGGDAQKILFIMAFAAVMFGCINGAREIVKEAAIYRRERTVNLGIIPYMGSKIVTLGLLCLLQSLVLTLMVNFKTPFQHSTFLPPFLEIYITMALTSLAGLMMGLTVSAIVPNNDRAMSVVPLILIPQVIFSGVIFSLDNPPLLQVLGALFPARWAMAAMGSTVGLHGDKLGTDGFSYWGTLFSTYSQAASVGHILLSWFFLMLTIVILGGLIAYFLKKKDVRG